MHVSGDFSFGLLIFNLALDFRPGFFVDEGDANGVGIGVGI